jgi:hypothetical protein
MRSGNLWRVNGVRSQTRQLAQQAADRAGVSLSEWLDDVVSDAFPHDAPRANDARRDDAEARSHAAEPELSRREIDDIAKALARLDARFDEVMAHLQTPERRSAASTPVTSPSVASAPDTNTPVADKSVMGLEARLRSQDARTTSTASSSRLWFGLAKDAVGKIKNHEPRNESHDGHPVRLPSPDEIVRAADALDRAARRDEEQDDRMHRAIQKTMFDMRGPIVDDVVAALRGELRKTARA